MADKQNDLISIFVDHRERTSGIVELLQMHGISPVVKTLPYGDFVINDAVIIERKTARDFLISIVDGRLFTQVAKMKGQGERCILLVEGDLFETDLKFSVEAIKGTLVSLATMWYLPVLFADNIEDTVSQLITISRQEGNQVNTISLRQGYRRKRLRSKQLYILQSLPTVGPIMAKRLLAHFKSVANVMGASPEQLGQVSGVGKVSITRIRSVLDTNIDVGGQIKSVTRSGEK